MAQVEVKTLELESISSFSTSIVSTSIVSTDGYEENDDTDELSNEEIEQLLTETLKSNQVLALETEMFEKAWQKYESKEASKSGVESSATSLVSARSDSIGAGLRVSRRRSRSSRGNILERFTQRLSTEQKCEIAQREIERYKTEIRKINEGTSKVLSNLKGVIKEAGDRSMEIKREAFEFERDIAKGAVNPVTKRINPEKAAKYWMERMQSLEALTLKLRLKNTALKVKRKRLCQVLKQQEETGDILHEVDFNQLKIENLQYMEMIEERSQDLIHLKLMTSYVLRVLNSYRQKLNALLSESRRLKLDIAARQELICRIDNETATVEDERIEAERINHKLRDQMEAFRVPEMFDFVESKAEIYDLKKKLQTWQRKADITTMALHTKRNAWRKVRREALQKMQDLKI